MDAPRLYKDMTIKYGPALIQEVFGSEMSAFVLNRIVKWDLSSPERYVLLQDYVELLTETMFSTIPVEDRFYRHLKDLEKTGIVYGKKALAEELGLKPFQLDALSKKYGINPFWEQSRISQDKKDNMVKIYLTSKERQKIHQAAQKFGFRYDNHFVKFCVERILKESL